MGANAVRICGWGGEGDWVCRGFVDWGFLDWVCRGFGIFEMVGDEYGGLGRCLVRKGKGRGGVVVAPMVLVQG